MNNYSVTALITAYNEERTIAEAIVSMDKALRKYTEDYEIIIFDDGSGDATGQIVDALASLPRNIWDGNQKRRLMRG